MANRPIKELFSRRFSDNPYHNKELKKNPNTGSPQQTNRMYRPKKKSDSSGMNLPTEAELDLLLAPPEMREAMKEKLEAQGEKEDPEREHLKGIELVNRHRYGDDVDILRATFTKSIEDIEKEKFLLIIACRRLCSVIFKSLHGIPRHEKYVLGGDIRNSSIVILKNSVAIKKRYYRKNLLEFIDIELDTLREYYRLARENYPEWMTEPLMVTVFNSLNEVGALIGGLMKSCVV